MSCLSTSKPRMPFLGRLGFPTSGLGISEGNFGKEWRLISESGHLHLTKTVERNRGSLYGEDSWTVHSQEDRICRRWLILTFSTICLCDSWCRTMTCKSEVTILNPFCILAFLRYPMKWAKAVRGDRKWSAEPCLTFEISKTCVSLHNRNILIGA